MSFVRKATSNRVFSPDFRLANNYVLATALLCNHRAITEVDTSVNAIMVTYWDWHQMCSFWRVGMESRKKCKSCNIWPAVLFYTCFPIANSREDHIKIGNRISMCVWVWIIIVTLYTMLKLKALTIVGLLQWKLQPGVNKSPAWATGTGRFYAWVVVFYS